MRPRDVRRRAITVRVLVAALKRAAFSVERQTGSHLTLAHPDGRRAILPVHSAPIRIGTLRSLLRKARMNSAELDEYL